MERPLSIVFKSFSGFAAFTKSIRLRKENSVGNPNLQNPRGRNIRRGQQTIRYTLAVSLTQ